MHVLRGFVTGLAAVAVVVTSAQVSPAVERDDGLTSAEEAAISRMLNDASAEAVAAVDCPPNDASIVPVSGKRCVAELMRRSRGQLLATCFNSAKAALPDALYGRTECKNGGGTQDEAIAQARYIQRLNDAGVYGKPATVGGISPDIQWEVKYSKPAGAAMGGRPDVVVYDRDDPNGPLEVVEVKKAAAEADANDQVQRYERDFPRGANNRPFVAKNLAGYRDSFRVLESDCAASGVTREVIDKYDVYPGQAGVLLFKMTDRQVRDCDDDDDGGNEGGEEVEEPEGIPEEIPQFCEDGCIVPAPGRDADGDGKDDFWEHFLEGHPELNDLPAWPELPPVPVPDEETIWVSAAVAAGLVVVALAVVAFCAGTAGGCVAFLGAAVAAEGGAMSVGVAAGIAAALAALGLGAWAIWGDPHTVTLDGRAYDLMSVGEFELMQVPELGLNFQARYVPLGGSVSLLDAIAFEIADDHVEIDSGTVHINGQEVSLSADGGTLLLDSGAAVVRDDSTYSVVIAGQNEGVIVQMKGRNLRVFASEGLETDGLLGNNNGDPSDDLVYGDGTPAGENPSPETLHGPFADSWRVTDETTLFSYGPGESPDTVADPDFPEQYVDLSDFSDSAIDAATDTCTAAEVLPGPAFDACVLDVILTADESFAADSALVTTVPYSPSQRSFENGLLAETFESAVGSNFSARSYMTVDSTTIVGPVFDTPGYRAHVSSVPRHDGVDIAFDLYVMGPVAQDTDEQSLVLEIDGQESAAVDLDNGTPVVAADSAWTFTPLAEGETGDGVSYSSFRASAHLAHAQSSLSVDMKPAGFRGVQGTAVGVDNIDFALDVPAPAVTTASLPLSVEPGAPGGFSSAGGADHYVFDVGEGDRLTFTPNSCTATASFTLIETATGQEVFDQSHCYASTTTAELSAGQYELRVSPWRSYGEPRAGSYGFDLFTVPEAQSFPYTPGDVVTDGAPAVGAGNLETISSVDRYTFTLTEETSLHYERLRSYMSYRIIDTATGDAVGDGYTDSDFTLPAGSYALEIGQRDEQGPYSFNLFPVPTPETFAYTLGETVTDGQPVAGAGNLETSASVDRYEFTLADETTLQYEQEVFKLFDYRIIDTATGDVVVEGTWDRQFTLPAGDYSFEVGHGNDQGTYSFTLFEVPEPETFEYTIGNTVTDGDPGSGAGTLETIASVDRFTFTLTEPAKIQYDRTAGYADHRLMSLSSGNVVAEGYGDQQFTVPPDEYAFEVTGYAGSYGFTLFDAPEPQTFDYELGTVVSNGVPAEGAGNLETVASIDRYNFTVTTAGEYQIDVPFLTDYIITEAQTGDVVLESNIDQRIDLTAADYVIQLGPGLKLTYTLQIFEIPAPQTFAYELGTTVSNGVPAAGAGNLETISSIDRYAFALTEETTLQYEYISPQLPFSYKIIDQADGQVVFHGGAHNQVTLPAGDYTMEFGTGDDGTYSFRFFEVPAPQVFAYELGTIVSNGVPEEGAGNLETIASIDQYTFTLTSETTLQYQYHGIPRPYQVVDHATGDVVTSGIVGKTLTLPPGDYSIDFGATTTDDGTYSFTLSQTAAAAAPTALRPI
ncbi:VWD domain-containing protein [Myceligenerans xiligouense]|uniref:von Willebrand factor type D domain-containing protein n=1 Tax=Myceligenerans xiligouense TaxID=253184 RepID=A0A3N4YJI9_9MICO|nr:VWD domain-containing protein [Myceligenerans xiligouense]RPF21309.1 von Willebrand factor type D domain-containing protein [Myceligenerans xiligouense]